MRRREDRKISNYSFGLVEGIGQRRGQYFVIVLLLDLLVVVSHQIADGDQLGSRLLGGLALASQHHLQQPKYNIGIGMPWLMNIIINTAVLTKITMTAVLNQQLRQALQNKYLTLDPLAQLQHLRSQSQLLLSIKQLLQKRKYINTEILSHNGFTSAPYSQLLDESITNSSEQVQLTFELDDLGTKSKLREEMESSSIQAALRDVQLHCGQETYQLVRQAVMANRAKEMCGLERMTAKLIEERDDLASQLLVLKMEKTNTERQMQKYKKIVSGVDEQKKTLKKKQDNLLKKQHQVFKLQASFAFKQKISLELKKRYERLVGSYISNQAKIERMYEELYKIWTLICDKVQSVDCKGNCWRKEAMRKAKEQLVEERKLIKEESSHLEREYEVMSIVSEQFKRIFHQPETGSGEKLPVDTSESNIKTEKSIKLEQGEQVPRLPIKIQ